MITVDFSGQEACIDAMSVREVRVWTPACPLAHAPSFMIGVINLRGHVLPIIDFAVRLRFPPTVPTDRHAILVVQVGNQTVGLLADAVSEILSVDAAMVQPALDFCALSEASVSAIIAMRGRMISLISLETVVPAAALEIGSTWAGARQ